MKSKRQEKILEIVRSRSVGTQEELMDYLQQAGFVATQATVSRDIKELRLVKTQNAGGAYCYAAPQKEGEAISGQFHSLFADAVQSVDYAGNIVVVRCLAGMAQAVCAAMDSIRHEEVVGTLAGEDTFICIVKTEEKAIALTEKLKKLSKK